jgi:hypothetical protein
VRDLIIIIAVAIGFPLFGLAVFFWWRFTYGVWSPRRRARQETEGNVQIISTRSKDSSAT